MVRTYERQLPKLNVEGSNPFGRSTVLNLWIDGKEYVWKDVPPPSTNGYYQHLTGGVEDAAVVFNGTANSGTYATTGPAGSGTYRRGP